MCALPEGRRKEMLAIRVARLLEAFAGRILPFETEAARRFAELAAQARKTRRGFPNPDGYIAAIAAANGFAVASRDGSAFRAAGVRGIDPWNVAG